MVMGNSNGGFDPRQNVLVGPRPVQLGQADFNKDGFLDLAVLSVGLTGDYGNMLSVLLGNGAGGFRTPFVEVLDTSDYNACFTVGDFNGDTWPDLALMEPGLTRMRIVLNGKQFGQVSFQEMSPPLSVDMGGVKISAGDFTGDGNSDIAVASSSEEHGTIKLYLSGGDGTFTAGDSVDISFSPTCMAVDKIDSDDTADIALGGGNPDSGKAAFIAGDGAGNLGTPVISNALPVTPQDLAVGDLNNDGLKELVLTLRDANLFVSLMLSTVSSGSEFLRGDENGDGVIDLSDAIKILIYLFKGDKTDCLESLDVNNDMKIDISDPVYLLTYLFSNGSPPSAPYPEVGPDPDSNTLGCER